MSYMKENIFRAFSSLIVLGGILSFVSDRDTIFQTSILDTISFVLVSMSFLLFAIGGSNFLSRSPFTKILNEKVSNIVNPGRGIRLA